MQIAAKQKVNRKTKVGGRPQCKSRTPVSRDYGKKNKTPWAGFQAGFEAGFEAGLEGHPFRHNETQLAPHELSAKKRGSD
jgi:hypothetical protein